MANNSLKKQISLTSQRLIFFVDGRSEIMAEKCSSISHILKNAFKNVLCCIVMTF